MANAETHSTSSGQAKTCQNCKNQFTIEPDDFAFYEKIHVPPPGSCPECRQRNRIIFRNFKTFYKRPSDKSKKPLVSMYSEGVPFPVWSHEEWWADDWDPFAYGRDFDFSRPFFEQFRELLEKVPRLSIIQQGNNPGSEYANRVTDNRSCYLNFGSTVVEYCRYSSFINYSKECVDCNNISKCERCYWCVDCSGCYQVAFSRESHQCNDSWFLVNCRNCQNCFGCVNLRNKSYCIFNEQYTKEEYEKRIKELGVGTRAAMPDIERKVAELVLRSVMPALVTQKSVDSSGNWIEESRDVHRSFGCRNTENVRYCFSIFSEKDAMDHSFWGNGSELMYETISAGIQCGSLRFCNECWSQDLDLQYCMNCHTSKYLFGCNGIRSGEYCILNKQYTKEDYEALVPKIVEQMKAMPYTDKHGRVYGYGEFFPIELSPFAYNVTLAQDFFPLDKAAILAQDYQFKDDTERDYKLSAQADALPDRAAEAPETITEQVIGCMHKGECADQCTTAFRILKEDFVLYKTASLPLPLLCPNCRHHERLNARNPLKLWPQSCQCTGSSSENGVYKNLAQHAHGSSHCENKFETSYAPDRPETVYCEACYNAEVV